MALVEKSFEEIITFTRASEATYFGSDGLMKTAAVDEPRIDYDPVTLEKKGLLVEVQRTNYALYSSELTRFNKRANAVVTANGGTGATANYYKIQNDVTDDYSGIFTGNSGPDCANKHFCTSVYLASVSGTTQAYLKLSAWSGGDGTPPTLVCDLTTTPKRFDLYRLFPAGSSGPAYMEVGPKQIGVPILAQYVNLEEGKYTTSFINTTSAAVSRSQDIVKVFAADEWTYGPKVGTYVIEYEAPNADKFTDAPRSIGYDNSSNANLAVGSGKSIGTWNGAQSLNIDIPATSFIHKAAITFDATGRGIAFNGYYSSDANIFQEVLSSISLMGAGNNNSSLTLSGWVKKVEFTPRRFTQQEMIDITTPV